MIDAGRGTMMRPFSQRLAQALLRLLGWQVSMQSPPPPRFVLVAAPHTSNWDFLLFLLAMSALDLRIHWVGKHTLFRGPFGRLMEALGGVPVDRRAKGDFVAQMVAAFKQREDMALAIAPEGTRSAAPYWRSGFYYIALGAGVPLGLGFLDYGRKEGGIGPFIIPGGDPEVDMAMIREFYGEMKGKHPENQGDIRLRPQPLLLGR